MKTVAIEDLMIGCILTFVENAAELGCPRDKEVDMWFRYLSNEEQYNVVEKMMKIEERNVEMNKEEADDKIVMMHEIELNLAEDVIDGLCQFALDNIKNDKKALINYAANLVLERIVETDGECLKDLKEKDQVNE